MKRSKERKNCTEIEGERRKKREGGEEVVAEVWKEDSGKAIRFL